MTRNRGLALFAVAFVLTPLASAAVFTRFGLDFVPVGAPGNRGATPDEAPG